MNCAYCSKPMQRSEAAADHIVPISRGGSAFGAENIRWVHRRCHNKPSLWQRFMRWIGRLRWRLIMWTDRRRVK